jgi:hypothetical protein
MARFVDFKIHHVVRIMKLFVLLSLQRWQRVCKGNPLSRDNSHRWSRSLNAQAESDYGRAKIDSVGERTLGMNQVRHRALISAVEQNVLLTLVCGLQVEMLPRFD